MQFLDVAVFVGFVALVVGVGLVQSRSASGEKGAAGYFLAGRSLPWYLVGFSLIAANISTEQFVGMSGKAADWLGMAIASYEWMAAVTLVVVAFAFLPAFLKSGIYTIPEFLEYRYTPAARTIMALSTLVILVGVPTASVIYSGAKVIGVYFSGVHVAGVDLGNIAVGSWIIGVTAAVYVFAGGLRACAWADLLQGAALIAGGAVVAYLVARQLSAADPAALTSVAGPVDSHQLGEGVWQRLTALNGGPLPEGRLHMVRPADDPELPWTALVLGLWIPNFFYWGFNQYITQRTLGAGSLDQGQRGIVFAAFLKLIIPFVVVIPGLLAFNLYSDDLASHASKENGAAWQRAQAEGQVVPFDVHFATLHPQWARRVVAHNAALVHDTAPAAADGAALAAANAHLVERGVRAGAAASRRLVGYDFDAAFPTLLKRTLPVGTGLLGFVLAAIFGAVVSSLASMLNSASTIFTMDLVRKVRPQTSEGRLVWWGRGATVAFALVAMGIAPFLDSPAFGGIFTFIQEFQGFISPGILAVFVWGMAVPRIPRQAGVVGLVLNPLLYGALKLWLPQVSFLNRMALCFVAVSAVLLLWAWRRPARRAVVLPVNPHMDMRTSPGTKVLGAVVVVCTAALYAVFW